jgi:hypothetical protein
MKKILNNGLISIINEIIVTWEEFSDIKKLSYDCEIYQNETELRTKFVEKYVSKKIVENYIKQYGMEGLLHNLIEITQEALVEDVSQDYLADLLVNLKCALKHYQTRNICKHTNTEFLPDYHGAFYERVRCVNCKEILDEN